MQNHTVFGMCAAFWKYNSIDIEVLAEVQATYSGFVQQIPKANFKKEFLYKQIKKKIFDVSSIDILTLRSGFTFLTINPTP